MKAKSSVSLPLPDRYVAFDAMLSAITGVPCTTTSRLKRTVIVMSSPGPYAPSGVVLLTSSTLGAMKGSCTKSGDRLALPPGRGRRRSASRYGTVVASLTHSPAAASSLSAHLSWYVTDLAESYTQSRVWS